MKSRLALLYGKTRTFTAIFDRMGTRKNYHKEGPDRLPTMVFVNVCNTKGEEQANHIWVRDITPFLGYTSGLVKGQRFRFKGRVDNFAKGSYDEDFHIVDIEKVKLLKPKKEKKAA